MKTSFVIRKATTHDLSDMVRMLADDLLGKQREKFSHFLPEGYVNAFKKINEDKNSELLVVELDKKIIGMAQVNYITTFNFQGGTRAQVEGVRIDSAYRSQGIGEQFINYIINCAKQHGCYMVQLTTHKDRTRAKKFYEKLGFIASHEGMKLML